MIFYFFINNQGVYGFKYYNFKYYIKIFIFQFKIAENAQINPINYFNFGEIFCKKGIHHQSSM